MLAVIVAILMVVLPLGAPDLEQGAADARLRWSIPAASMPSSLASASSACSLGFIPSCVFCG